MAAATTTFRARSPLIQRGYILLPVVLAILLVATVALLLNNQGTMGLASTTTAAEAEKVQQLAESALAHALWGAQNSACAGDISMGTVPFGQSGTYSASITTPGGSTTAYALSADQDAWFRSDQITVNNGAAASHHLRMESGILEYAVVRFDLSTLPVGAQINSAIARFFVKATKGHPEGPVTVHRTTADWTEDDATWETMSTNFDSVVLQTIPAQPLAGGNWVDINLTAQLQAWVNGEANYGVMLLPTDWGTHGEYISREGTPSEAPQLNVIIGTGAASPASITATGILAGTGTPPVDISRVLTRTNVPAYQPGIEQVLLPNVDSYLYEWKSGWNYGVSNRIWVDEQFADSTANGLLKLDLTSIPKRARVLSAVLELYQANSSLNGGPVGVHRITSDWIEGTKSGGNGTTNWTERDTSVLWDSVGGDYDAAAGATSIVPAGTGWSAWDITDLLNGWVSGAFTNNGLALVPQNSGTAAHFASSDEADATLHPKLSLTYACECGSACITPQGTGNVLLVVADPANLIGVEAYKKKLIESWGYTVNLIDDDALQAAYDTAVAANVVVYISASVGSGAVATKLTNAPIGVINEEGALDDELGFSSTQVTPVPVGDSLDITDTSHYITQLFPAGPLTIYTADMGGHAAFGTLAPGLQVLANWGASPGLAVIDSGAALGGGALGANAAGRRVLVPFGQDNTHDWSKVNNNSLLIMQRALQWGASSPAPALIYRDEFTNRNCDAADYTGSDGELDWSVTPWVETADDGDSCNGDIRLWTDGAAGNYSPRLNNTGNILERSVDLTGFVTAYLSFDYRRLLDSSTDQINVEISSDGGANWTVLNTFSGIVTDSAYLPRSNDISAFISADTVVRVNAVNLASGGGSLFYFDNVQISEAAPVTSRPIAHWKLDDGAGSVAIDSEGGHDGTLTNSPAWVVGQINGALSFDGSNDYINVPHDDTLLLTGGMTFSAWANTFDTSSGYKAIISKDIPGNGASNYWFGTNNDELVFGFWAAGVFKTVETSGANLQTGAWYLLTASFDNATDEVRLYVDGTQLHLGTLSDEPTTETADLWIGKSVDGEYWDGLLDDVRIYDSALPATNVANLYASGGGGGGSGNDILLVVGNAATLTQSDDDRWNMMIGWGYTVTVIDDGEPQAVFDAAVAANNVIFVTNSVVGGSLADKLTGASKGIVNEFPGKLDNFGFSSGTGQAYSSTGFSSTDAGHTITSPYGGAPVTVFTGSTLMSVPSGTLAPGLQNLGSPNGAPLDLDVPPPGLSTLETAALRWDGNPAPARRVHLPLGLATVSQMTADGLDIMQRSLQWAGGGCNGTFRDEFNARSYANSDGTLSWAGDWLEVGESDGPTAGDEGVGNDQSDFQLRVRDNENGGEGVEREADLSGAATATLTFDYRRNGLDSSSDYVAIYASSTGTAGPYTELPAPRIEGGGTDAGYQTYSRDISAYISATTAIRLQSSSTMGNLDIVWFDNIQIQCSP